MNDECKGFIRDVVVLLQEKYNASLMSVSGCSLPDEAQYYSGANFAYFDALDLIRSQLLAFGYIDLCKTVTPEFGKPIDISS
jgi:hypothetical protein